MIYVPSHNDETHLFPEIEKGPNINIFEPPSSF